MTATYLPRAMVSEKDAKAAKDPSRLRMLLDQKRRRLARLTTLRQPWFNLSREIVEETIPQAAGRWFVTDKNQQFNAFQHIYDTTATQNLLTGAAGMQAISSPPSGDWFGLTLDDPEMANFPAHREWLDTVDRILESLLPGTGTYEANHGMYLESMAVGGACSLYVPHHETVACQYPITAGEYFLAQNSRGDIDTMYREFTMTVGQLVEEFKDGCSQRVLDQFRDGDYDCDVKVYHAIEPRRNRDHTKIDRLNMPFSSVYWEADASDKVLRESGFRRFPVLTPRWGILPGETYPYGPGIMALSASRSLQQKQYRLSQMVNLKADPAWQGDTPNKGQDFKRGPGQFTFAPSVNPQGAIRPLHVPPNSEEAVLMLIEDHRRQLDKVFFTDLFLMFKDENLRDVRQEAIFQKQAEKLQMLGPVSSNLTNGMLASEVELTYAYATEEGLIPPAPPDLAGQMLKVKMDSILAKSQRQANMGAEDRALGRIGSVAGWMPEIIDAMDADEIADSTLSDLGVHPKWLRAQQDRQRSRDTRNQVIAQQKQLEAGAIQAKTALDLSKAQVGTDPSQNMLAALAARGGQ